MHLYQVQHWLNLKILVFYFELTSLPYNLNQIYIYRYSSVNILEICVYRIWALYHLANSNNCDLVLNKYSKLFMFILSEFKCVYAYKIVSINLLRILYLVLSCQVCLVVNLVYEFRVRVGEDFVITEYVSFWYRSTKIVII